MDNGGANRGADRTGASTLLRHQLFATRELDEARERIARAYRSHRLSYAGGGQRLDAVFCRAAIGCDSSINRLRYGADVMIDPGPLDTFYLIQIPLEGRCEVEHQGRTVASSARTASIVSPSRPVTMRWGGDCDQLMLQINRRALERFVEQTLQVPLHDPLVFEPELPLDSPCGTALKDLLLFVAEGADRGSPVVAMPQVANQLTWTVLSLLLAKQPHNYAAALGAGRSDAVPAGLKRAIDYIEANLDQPVTLAEIVEAAGVSTRALFDAFHRFRNCTPMAFLKARRLDRARSRLSAGPTVSVTEVALACGFNHFGNFAADYRRLYGESPSQTLRRRKAG